MKISELPPVITFPRDAVLELSHLSAALRVSEEIVARMDLPFFMAGKRQRFIWGVVFDVLVQRATTNDSRPRLSA